MRFRSVSLPVLILLAAIVASPRTADAQSQASANGSNADATDAVRPITPADYGQWERMGSATLSPDGRWLAVPITRVNEENELRIRLIDSDSLIVIPFGLGARFSGDSRWLAYTVGRSEEAREELEEQNKPVHQRVGLFNLVTGDTTLVEGVGGFQFSHDGRYVALRGYPPTGKRESKGADVVVRELETGTDMNFGNVSHFAWQDEGELLAFIVDAEGEAGNGVRLYDPASGTLRSLESERARFTALQWREESDDLAFLRVLTDSTYEDSSHTIIAWRNLQSGDPDRFELDPTEFAGFPDDTRVVDYRTLRWSEDGRTLFFGIKDWRRVEDDEAAADSSEAPDGEAADSSETADGEAADSTDSDDDEEPAGVEIWHAKDVDVLPAQKVFVETDRRENFLAAWQLDEARFVQLGTELTEKVSLRDGSPHALGFDETPYDRERMFGPEYRDVYRVDIATGEREKIVERVEYRYGLSAEGRYFLFFRDDHYWTYDFESGQLVNVTADVATSFVNAEADVTRDQKPPFGFAGWTEGDDAVLLNDKFDVWEIRPDGSEAVRLTRGAEDSIRYRYQSLDFSQDYIDTDEPMLFSMYGEWTKKFGYAHRRSGRQSERALWMDARVSRIQGADSAETYVFVTERFDDSPDYYAAGPGLANPRQVTETNAFQSEYAWGHTELIEFENTWGTRLQGSLAYPADYEPGRQYPMIVYIYERLSQGTHTYSVPSERSPYNDAVFTAEGYFVFRPDIVYRDRDPGVSAVAAIEPAVAAAIATGMIDPDRVGLVGHSWGGYQTAFAVTQTDIFSAAVAGAPLTNLFSMYLSMYWNSGGTDARIFEISQGRMEVPFWEDVEAYRRNSPVFHIEDMNTPLLVTFGTEDGAVDFNQGVEFYNAARRAEKDFVLLVYEGENHGLRKKPNQLDYHRRILEWFGHYLQGDDAPTWISTGVPYVEQERAQNGRK
ncbi:MAG: prolyl oligopeptidase family serine peptidase [Gemmatimonadetes bacterium]|nr:prolyl oligopeptidase family serine peptidase [Gemmatimonadota bacterium]